MTGRARVEHVDDTLGLGGVMRLVWGERMGAGGGVSLVTQQRLEGDGA